ncbi:carbamoyl-phosphate synthase large subunit [Clostridium beijerinckii]|uniref:carboxylate--amine ligase n=1 Tax=Clostridium beijerinckii TaxID=1520 RepID=UPI001493F7AB|nr:carboxylate--amine ligase [Clostridium beijerinckii]NOW89443.1 carbamoyl-phosphate synthase large subunit [Clostridium beijerinckii]
MSKIIIAGAGGAPSENVIRSLSEGNKENEIIGMGSEPMDLMLSQATRKYYVPYAIEANYKDSLLKLLNSEKPDLVHFQNDIEIREASRIREDIISTGTKMYMPSKETIEICVDKSKSSLIWQSEGIRIPKTFVVNDEKDLKKAFEILSNKEGKIWIRATEGGGGKGALPADNYDFAKIWIDRFNGWGNFTAAELLDSNTITWLSIWYEGELVVAQTRKRNSWNFSNRTLSGVTGITRVGETCSDETVNKVAVESILSIDKKPHGIYGVDMTYDFDGFPNPTEINISRFFTTVYFFTKAGLNLPQIFADIALNNKFPNIEKRINPLPDGLLWIRGMDREPILTTEAEIKKAILGL